MLTARIMAAYTSDLLRLLDARGYIHQVTDPDGLDALARKEIVPGYIGFDATAPSLHVGSLVQIMMLRRLQQVGHKPIVLMGGGTTKIGDPSGKDESRQLLTEERIAANIASIRRVFEHFLVFGDGPSDAILVDNGDWLDALDYIPFLREIGPHFTINRMLTFDSVRMRLEREQPLTFLEFNYMILQAYDFLELSRRAGCRLQLGGSDQWGNIVNGIELGRRVDGAQLYGVTTPLITTADGGKMGKTEKGAIWLNADLCSPYDYWQFWRNTQDADVGRFLRLFTDIATRRDRPAGGAEGPGDQRGQARVGECGYRHASRRVGSDGGGRHRAKDVRRRNVRGRFTDFLGAFRRDRNCRCSRGYRFRSIQGRSSTKDRRGSSSARRNRYQRPRLSDSLWPHSQEAQPGQEETRTPDHLVRRSSESWNPASLCALCVSARKSERMGSRRDAENAEEVEKGKNSSFRWNDASPRATTPPPHRAPTGKGGSAPPRPRSPSSPPSRSTSRRASSLASGARSAICSGAGEAELGLARLAGAQYLAGAAQPQILLGDAEAVIGLAHQREPRARRSR